MKPKSTLFISATLTVFVLVILAGVVTMVNTAKTNEVALATGSTDAPVIETPTQLDPTATQPVQVDPVQAASIAAQFLNRSDVYSVEGVTINGVNAYKVVFSSGDVVYVGLDGVVISTETLQPTVIVNAPAVETPNKRRNNGGNGGSGNGGQNNHEQDEHQHEDDD